MSRSWLDELTLQTVILHLKSENCSLKGPVAAVHADCVILRDAVLLEPEAQTVLGEVVVPRDNIDFIQRVT